MVVARSLLFDSIKRVSDNDDVMFVDRCGSDELDKSSLCFLAFELDDEEFLWFVDELEELC